MLALGHLVMLQGMNSIYICGFLDRVMCIWKGIRVLSHLTARNGGDLLLTHKERAHSRSFRNVKRIKKARPHFSQK